MNDFKILDIEDLELEDLDDNDYFDVRVDISKIRLKIGFCQQHDILFDKLTVWEHLNFFYSLKSADLDEKTKNVNEVLELVQLTKNKNFQVHTLSGGLKRRLSLAMALIGDSQLIILDEPTTGLDAVVREQIWRIIKESKVGRSILVTTQHLEEAEIISDGLGMLETGKLVAQGSVDEIKKKFGVGYNLKVYFSQADPN
mmetsp:Transcript_34189/g.33388  ORF Transcript_34189/g.33388 Transcript_34189/m.33388 type:complete len:199 (+) Transcript_34189:1198-1794(+)